MHSIELLHKTFEEKLPGIHKNRLKSLMIACEAGRLENKVYLTGLGRAILNTNKENSNIQKVDRLSHYTYGGRRVRKALNALGYPVGRKKTKKLMD